MLSDRAFLHFYTPSSQSHGSFIHDYLCLGITSSLFYSFSLLNPLFSYFRIHYLLKNECRLFRITRSFALAIFDDCLFPSSPPLLTSLDCWSVVSCEADELSCDSAEKYLDFPSDICIRFILCQDLFEFRLSRARQSRRQLSKVCLFVE